MLNKLETNKKWLVYFPLIVYWVIIFIATTLPGRDLPDIGLSDKTEHFAAYMFLAVLLNLALMFQNKFPVLKKKAWLFTLIFTLSYAGFDEFHQLFVPDRKCDIFDWLSDTTGVLLGIGFVRLLIIYFKYKPQTR